MADMNHLELAQPVDIDPNEVLRDYGLDNTEHIATVAQTGDTIVNIPENPAAAVRAEESAEEVVEEGLTPPALDSSIIDDLDALADSMLLSTTEETSTESNIEPLAADSGLPPVVEEPERDELELEELPLTDTNESSPLDTSEPHQEEVHAEEGGEADTTVMSAEEAIKLLPVNSKSHLIDESTSRFSGAAWYHAIQESSLILAGLGGIGSYVLFCLSRMKPKQIFIYDDDIVETANLSGQLYSSTMVGQRKVDAMAELAMNFSVYYNVQAIPHRFTSTTPASDIMICGFDNMQARLEFFTAWVNHLVNHPHPEKCLFIDGRLNMEEFQVFCMKGDDVYNIKRYQKECMFKDREAESIVCSMKQTTYCANMIGSVIVNLYTNFIANQLKPLIDRDLPFKTYYDASMMFFKTEA